jgi:flagellar motor switch protein FliM
MSDQILSQEDIDALFAAIRDGKIDLENDPDDAIMEGVEKSKTRSGTDAARGLP